MGQKQVAQRGAVKALDGLLYESGNVFNFPFPARRNRDRLHRLCDRLTALHALRHRLILNLPLGLGLGGTGGIGGSGKGCGSGEGGTGIGGGSGSGRVETHKERFVLRAAWPFVSPRHLRPGCDRLPGPLRIL